MCNLQRKGSRAPPEIRRKEAGLLPRLRVESLRGSHAWAASASGTFSALPFLPEEPFPLGTAGTLSKQAPWPYCWLRHCEPQGPSPGRRLLSLHPLTPSPRQSRIPHVSSRSPKTRPYTQWISPQLRPAVRLALRHRQVQHGQHSSQLFTTGFISSSQRFPPAGF